MTTEKPVPLSTLEGAFVRYDNSLADVAKDGEYDSLLNPPSIPSILDAYPVGAIYMSVNSTNPGTLFGGTWERIEGKFLLAATDDGDSGAAQEAGNTGGEAEHTLTADESGIPAHSHGLNSHTHSVGAHSHGLNEHVHSVPAHSHTLGNHSHTVNNHTHSYLVSDTGTGGTGLTEALTGSHRHTATRAGNGNTQDSGSYLAQYSTNSDLQYSLRGLWDNPNSLHVGYQGGGGSHGHSIGRSWTDTGGSTPGTSANNGNTGEKAAFNTAGASGNTANSTVFNTGAASGNTAEVIALNATDAHNNMPPYLSVYVWKRVS